MLSTILSTLRTGHCSPNPNILCTEPSSLYYFPPVSIARHDDTAINGRSCLLYYWYADRGGDAQSCLSCLSVPGSSSLPKTCRRFEERAAARRRKNRACLKLKHACNRA